MSNDGDYVERTVETPTTVRREEVRITRGANNAGWWIAAVVAIVAVVGVIFFMNKQHDADRPAERPQRRRGPAGAVHRRQRRPGGPPARPPRPPRTPPTAPPRPPKPLRRPPPTVRPRPRRPLRTRRRTPRPRARSAAIDRGAWRERVGARRLGASASSVSGGRPFVGQDGVEVAVAPTVAGALVASEVRLAPHAQLLHDSVGARVAGVALRPEAVEAQRLEADGDPPPSPPRARDPAANRRWQGCSRSRRSASPRRSRSIGSTRSPARPPDAGWRGLPPAWGHSRLRDEPPVQGRLGLLKRVGAPVHVATTSGSMA